MVFIIFYNGTKISSILNYLIVVNIIIITIPTIYFLRTPHMSWRNGIFLFQLIMHLITGLDPQRLAIVFTIKFIIWTGHFFAALFILLLLHCEQMFFSLFLQVQFLGCINERDRMDFAHGSLFRLWGINVIEHELFGR